MELLIVCSMINQTIIKLNRKKDTLTVTVCRALRRSIRGFSFTLGSLGNRKAIISVLFTVGAFVEILRQLMAQSQRTSPREHTERSDIPRWIWMIDKIERCVAHSASTHDTLLQTSKCPSSRTCLRGLHLL